MTSPARSSWLEVTLTLPHECAEAAGNVLLEWGAPGLIEGSAGAAVLLTAHLPGAPSGFGRRLRAYLKALGEASGIPGPFAARLARRADPGWASQWRTFHRPLRFGRLVVAPSWCDLTLEPGEALIRLDPGMAFGTGQHPTTASCLRALAAWIRPEIPVLDLGTGSGLLALAAASLGARPVFALDTDPAACAAAAANSRRNDLSAVVHVCCGSLDALAPRATFAVIVANLTGAAHLALLPDLAARLAPGGRAALAGILEEQAPQVRRAALAAGLAVVGSRRAGDWVTLHLTRSA